MKIMFVFSYLRSLKQASELPRAMPGGDLAT